MKKLLYISLILLLASCYNQSKPKKPDNLISKNQMVNMIIDMSIYNSAKGVNKRILEKNGIKLKEHIYKKHKIDSAQFASSNLYYTYNTEEYKKIYVKVRDSLTKLKEKYKAIEKVEEKQKKKRDSIKRTKLKSTPKKNFLNKAMQPAAVSNKKRKVSRKPK